MTQDLENRIRNVCAQITKANPADFEGLIADLKAILHEHSLKLGNLIAAQKLILQLTLDKAMLQDVLSVKYLRVEERVRTRYIERL